MENLTVGRTAYRSSTHHVGSNGEGSNHGSAATSHQCCNGHRTAREVVEERLQLTDTPLTLLHSAVTQGVTLESVMVEVKGDCALMSDWSTGNMGISKGTCKSLSVVG